MSRNYSVRPDPCARWVSYKPVTPANVTLLMLDSGSPVLDARTGPRIAHLRLPGEPNLSLTVQLLALCADHFEPVRTTQTVETDDQGYFDVSLPDDAIYYKLKTQFTHQGQSMTIDCYSHAKLDEVFWNDNLSIRAALLRTNRFAVDCSGRDHEKTGAGQQKGPCKAARAIGINQAAIFEALNSILGLVPSYFSVTSSDFDASVEAAIAKASRDTLVALFSAQTALIDQELASNLATIPVGAAKTKGIAVGAKAAVAVLAERSTDGSAAVAVEETWDQYKTRVYGVDPVPVQDWAKDPISNFGVALGSRWPQVRPVALPSGDYFRESVVGAPPGWKSYAFASELSEVKAVGATDPTPHTRTADAELSGQFWAYDGTPSLCAPPRLYNQVATQLATLEALPTLEFARMLAVLNLALTDAAIAGWDSKYHYKLARPVTLIRNIGLNNAHFVEDPTWTPLGAPNSNAGGPNFTPPFPAYVSGHACFGGSLFQVLRAFLGRDDIAFTFVSDELNGVTQDSEGNARPLHPRSFTTLSQAEEENAQSRMPLGIHYACDRVKGIALGHAVADYLLDHVYKLE